MKKVLSIVVMMLCIFCFTGCMRINYTVDVKKDGTADLYFTYAVMDTTSEMTSEDEDSSSSSQSATDLYGEEMDKAREEGWEVSEYNENSYIGYTGVKRGIPLEDVAKEFNGTSNDEVEMDSDVFSITKDGNNYSLIWKTTAEEQEEAEEIEEYSSVLAQSGGYATFTLKLPRKAKSSNATTVSDDGKTLEWDLTKVNGDITAEFSLFNTKLLITIIVIIFFVALVVFLVLGHLRKNGPGHNEGPNGNGPMDFSGGQGGPGGFPQQGFPQQPQQPQGPNNYQQ